MKSLKAKPIKALTSKEKAVVQKLSDKEKAVVSKIARKRESVFQRFPLLFTMLGTFGLVAVLYGFEGIIDRIETLANNPVILLIVGVIILILTGTLYKKLD